MGNGEDGIMFTDRKEGFRLSFDRSKLCRRPVEVTDSFRDLPGRTDFMMASGAFRFLFDRGWGFNRQLNPLFASWTLLLGFGCSDTKPSLPSRRFKIAAG